jgi:hypothetical protein
MNYVHFYESIGAVYNIDAIGWPVRFVNPSNLSDSIPPLIEFRDSLIAGTCYFKKLTSREVKDRAETYRAAVNDGRIAPVQRKTRKDKGTKKTAASTTAPPVNTVSSGKRGAVKSREVISSDSESDESNDAASAPPNPAIPAPTTASSESVPVANNSTNSTYDISKALSHLFTCTVR